MSRSTAFAIALRHKARRTASRCSPIITSPRSREAGGLAVGLGRTDAVDTQHLKTKAESRQAYIHYRLQPPRGRTTNSAVGSELPRVSGGFTTLGTVFLT